MVIKDKLECVSYAKALAIRYQKWDVAASLREDEKYLANQLNLDDYKSPYQVYLKGLNLKDLNSYQQQRLMVSSEPECIS